MNSRRMSYFHRAWHARDIGKARLHILFRLSAVVELSVDEMLCSARHSMITNDVIFSDDDLTVETLTSRVRWEWDET